MAKAYVTSSMKSISLCCTTSRDASCYCCLTRPHWILLSFATLYYFRLNITQFRCHRPMISQRNYYDSIGYRTWHNPSWLALNGLKTVLHTLTTNRPLVKYPISLSTIAKQVILCSSPVDSHQLQRHHNWATTHQLPIKIQTQPNRASAYQVNFRPHPVESHPIRSFCVSRE